MSLLWQARFYTTVNQLSDLPNYKVPEIAFAGRSNAGKSTAINLLCNQKKLAFASKTPGRTQHINFFSIGGAHVGQHRKDPTRVDEIKSFLVDLPGYGYAKVSQSQRGTWTKMIWNYVEKRENFSN
jgi:GTP-binding protein